MWIQTALEQLLWELRQWRAPASIASEQAINRLSGYPTTGIPSEQGINRELRSMTDKKVTRAHVNDTYLEDLVAVWTPPADCG